MIYVRCIPIIVLLVAANIAVPEPAVAAVSAYVNVPDIVGVDPTPGYPRAMAVSSVTLEPNVITITKQIDDASSQLFAASVVGTPLGTMNALFYNTAPTGPPDATLDFFNVLVSAYQALDATEEEVAFNADNPLDLYLEVAGIPGESSTPGHANIMHIQSFALTGNEFTIVKLQDTASDDLFLANAQGVLFPAARLLLYDVQPPGGSPDAVMEFHNLLISASQTISNPGQPMEQHTFDFATLSQPIPEPAGVALAGIAGIVMAGTSRRRLRGRCR